jgi:hypothetical protein
MVPMVAYSRIVKIDVDICIGVTGGDVGESYGLIINVDALFTVQRHSCQGQNRKYRKRRTLAESLAVVPDG